MNLYRRLFFISILLSITSVCGQGWRLVWSDEFDGESLNDDDWNVVDWPPGRVNAELQRYIPGHDEANSNVWLENGNLVIEARKIGDEITSGRINSSGKQQWLYGKYEARAKLPPGLGTWPAIWSMPSNSPYGGWPTCGEIDIMEYVGYQPDLVFCTIHCDTYNHTKGTQVGTSLTIEDVADDYHVFGIEWWPDSILGYADDTCYFKFENEHTGSDEWPFDQEFHWILNVAIGGSWGGAQGVDDNIFPCRMEVDYVRVYQWDEDLATVGAGPENVSGQQGLAIVKRSMTPSLLNVTFRLEFRSDVAVSLYDLSGRMAGEVFRGRKSAGTHSISADVRSHKLADGVYMLRLTAGGAAAASTVGLIN